MSHSTDLRPANRSHAPESASLYRESHHEPVGSRPGEREQARRIEAGRRAESEDLVPYLRYGIPAGVLGAFVVAVFFLILDVAAGRPFATPNALGTALFLDRPFDPMAPLSAAIITGYTAVHGAVFIAMASIAAVLLLSARRLPEGGTLFFGLTALLFVACEAVFLCLSLLAGFSLWSELGFGRVAIANALASASMAALLARGAAPHQRRAAAVMET